MREPSDSLCESAMIKSIRRGLDDDAVYWAVKLSKRGRDDVVWRRLYIHMSEDIGLANETLPSVIHALHRSYVFIQVGNKTKYESDGSERLPLIHAVLLLARSKKSRTIDNALNYHLLNREKREIPDYAIDYHSPKGRRMGRDAKHFLDCAAKLYNEDLTIRDKWSKKLRKILLRTNNG